MESRNLKTFEEEGMLHVFVALNATNRATADSPLSNSVIVNEEQMYF